MKKVIYVISIIFILLGLVLIGLYLYSKPLYFNDSIKTLKVDSYNEEKDESIISISFKENYKGIKCSYSEKEDQPLKWVNIKNKKCTLTVKGNDLKYVYLKKGPFKKQEKITDLVLGIKVPKKIYLALNEKSKVNLTVKTIGNNLDIIYKPQKSGIIKVEKNEITGKKVGTTKVDIYINNRNQGSFTVDVTSLITKRPKKFNDNKKYLPCNKYNEKETAKLEDILKTKMESVGYPSRASAVEAIRFLMLDFKYQITYFFENGRLQSGGGMHYADGEGRYYHKGLYLNESKIADLENSFAKPAIWGCPLMNYEDYGTEYKAGTYHDNGLDCSGFITWGIYNGGFDVGDRGSGDNELDENEINDVGDKSEVTDEIIKSDKVKAGDLLSYWGHIAMIVGKTNDTLYVAESLWTFGGPVINEYDINKVDDEFTQLILMDKVYKEDGAYTDMWY